MKKLFFLSLISLSLSSCSTWYRSTQSYINNVPYAPMFEEEGELSLSGNIGFNHGEAQGAVSVKNGYGLKFSIYNGTDGRSYSDIGIGKFKEFRENNYYELFAGYGEGLIRNNTFKTSYSIIAQYYYDYYTVDANFKRYYIQPAYYFTGLRGQKMEVGLRMSYINYPTYYYERIHESNTEPDFMDKVELTNQKGIYLEPTYSYRRKISKAVCFNFQAGFSFGWFNQEFNSEYSHPVNQKYFINTGLQLNLHDLFN